MHLSAFLIAQLAMTVAQLDTPQQTLPGQQIIVVPQPKDDLPGSLPPAGMHPTDPQSQIIGDPFAITDPIPNQLKLPPPADNLPEYDNQRALQIIKMNTVIVSEDFKKALMKLERPDVQLWIFIMSRDTGMQGNPSTWPDQVLNERILAKWRKEPGFSGVDNYLILVWVGIEPDPAKQDFTGYFAAEAGPELQRRGLTAAALKAATGPLQIANPGRLTTNPSRDIPQVVRNCFSYIGPPPTWWEKNLYQLIIAAVFMLASLSYGYACDRNTEEEVCQADKDSANRQEPSNSTTTTAKGVEDMTEDAQAT